MLGQHSGTMSRGRALKSKNAKAFRGRALPFSCFGIGEVADLDNLKGGGSRPSDQMTLSTKKRFFEQAQNMYYDRTANP
jgi:hypothetical protein